MDKTFTQKVAAIQEKIKAPKSRTNKFGGYTYRSAEDITEAIKPLLNGLALIVSDSIEMIGDRFYVRATAKITDGESELVATGYAREASEKKGNDSAQLTGLTSSYARKVALSGLMLLDDSDDSDAQEPAAPVKQKITDARFNKAIEAIKKGEYTVQQMTDNFNLTPSQQAELSGYENV